jgi:DNA-binding transcriptional LysR family regulator
MDSSRPDLNLLVTFEALLAERNVTRAAARLHLSQPAVSAQLARLRDLFADPLLIPARRGMTPTAKALALFETLRPSLDALRAGLAAHRDFDPQTAKLRVAIACSDYTQSVVVVPLATGLRQTAPGLRLAVVTINPKDIAAQMASGGVDLAFLTPEITPPGMRRQNLFQERYVLIGRHGHPRLKRRPSLEHYLKLDHIVVSPQGGGFTTPVDDALAAEGLKRNVVLSAASFLVVPEIVARSDFVALVPERLLAGRAERLCVREPPLPVRGFAIDMVWHERAHGHPGQRWLRETIAALV